MTENTTAPIVDYVPIYSCGHCVPSHVASLPSEYIDETWPTIGGGSFRVTRCFLCRRTVKPFDTADPRWRSPQGLISAIRAAPPETMEE